MTTGQPREACKSYDPEWWFPLPKDEVTQAGAKAVCWMECQLREECLAKAFSFKRHPDGIWGGYTKEERAALAKMGMVPA